MSYLEGQPFVKLQLNVANGELDPILPALPIFPKNLGVYILKNIESSNF